MSDDALGPLAPAQRREASERIRTRAAESHADTPAPEHHSNGDDERYAGQNHYATFSKGLQHDPATGEVTAASYASLRAALMSGRPSDFEEVILGVPAAQSAKLTDPQAGLAFALEGIDGHQLTLPPCYAFRSKGAIGEIAENYWLALCRGVPFINYATDPLIAQAAADLNRYAVFDGPKAGGAVTPATAFRANAPGALAGPYLSQFMINDIPYGSQRTPARIAYGVPAPAGGGYMTDEASWLAVQNGTAPTIKPGPLPNPSLLHDGQGLGDYVHIDELFQAYLNACLLLITPRARGGFGVSVSDDNPYKNSRTQVGFGTLGEPNFKVLVAEVATRALKAVWFQKWYVHRRIRPEAYAGRLHWHLKGARSYEFDAAELAKLEAGPLAHPTIVAAQHFLPMAFPEGSPTHPAYGAGHATVAGACVTVLKALFKTDVTLASLGVPVMQPNADGTALVPYAGADRDALTVGGELDKLAANVGIARNFAGVHWRSDYSESVKLGEQVAYYFLQDTVQTYNEDIAFSWREMDGTPRQVSKVALPAPLLERVFAAEAV
jgi:membrane-associated phospholipid phosphatase